MDNKDDSQATDIFSDLAGGNDKLRRLIGKSRVLWQQHANRRTKIISATLVVLGLCFYILAVRAPSAFPVNTLVTVESGQSFTEIVADLKQQGVVRSTLATRVIAVLYGVERNMHSGDYLFKSSASLFEVINRLGTGAFGLGSVKVRVREGSTVADIAELLESKMLRFDKDKFLEMASKSEGYLYPDTYHFLPNAKESTIVGAMVDNFHKQYKEVAKAAKATGYSMHEIVTLASIVELEAHKYTDRRKIAGVMYNRLEINMPLQVDVSFVYILGKGTFDITLEDLKNESLYNTYVHKGLPPGPIGSPSMASLRATVDPIESDWIFYLADRAGTTHYSDTYAQHLAKKRRYIDNR